MTKRWFKPEWYRDIARQQIMYFEGGSFEEGELLDLEKTPPRIIMSRMAYEDLLDFIRKNEKGILSTDREEDLKIIHRLCDILQKSVELGNKES